MMHYQLLALDIDGTLVGADTVMTPRVARALQRVRQQGGRVCLCTGRPLAAVRRYVAEVDPQMPPVVFNGALVPGIDGAAPLCERALAPEVIAQLVRESRAGAHYLELHTAERYYAERLGPEAEFQREKLQVGPVVRPFDGFWEQERILKAQFMLRQAAQVERLQALEAAVGGRATFSWSVSPGFEGHYINVTAPGVDKATALDALLRHMGIPWERVLAAGDSVGDLVYVRRAGCGVMLGAGDWSHDAPVHVFPSADEDGLALALETLLEQNHGRS